MNIKYLFDKGTVIADKYQIIRFLETGSLGDDIYLCHHVDDAKRLFTIRLLPTSIARDQEMLERFIQEVKINKLLAHPNILPAVDIGKYKQMPFLVTGYIESESLKFYLANNGKLNNHQTLAIIIPLIQALKYAWDSQKIIHRNIKPESILIASPEFPLLQDFGLSKMIKNESASMDLTMMDVTIGNADYMSPEQATGSRNLDFRSDMYCLGLVAYEMLTNKHPLGRLSQIAMMMAQVNRDPQPIKQIEPTVNDKLAHIITKMLAKKADERYSSWDELLEQCMDVRTILGRSKRNSTPSPTVISLVSEKTTEQVEAPKQLKHDKATAASTAESTADTISDAEAKSKSDVQPQYATIIAYHRIISGAVIIFASLMGLFVSNYFFYLVLVIGLGIFQAGFTKWCLLEKIIGYFIQRKHNDI